MMKDLSVNPKKEMKVHQFSFLPVTCHINEVKIYLHIWTIIFIILHPLSKEKVVSIDYADMKN